MTVATYNHKIFEKKKEFHKPFLPFFKQEKHRRDPTLKGYKNKSVRYFLDSLAEDNFKLPIIDVEYLQRFLKQYSVACKEKIA
jgi:hypothetical protein